MAEVWKDIKGYEALYQVSNLGRVKSLNYHRTGKERILKPGTQTKGYLKVPLYKYGKIEEFRVHRLVAEAFIPNPNKYPCVNHKDENKQNNSVDNLEWCTVQYNTVYSCAKPVYCVELDKVFQSIHEAERQTGINKGNIVLCCQRKYKTAGGYNWQYVKNKKI